MTSDVRREIAEASRILAGEGVLDAFGHVSRRHPDRNDRFFISRSLAPALVTAEDVVELDLDAERVSGDGGALFLERYIHSEIYRRSPGVHAVVHSHAAAVLPFTVVPSVPVRPLLHMCGFLCGTQRPFDVADHAGPATDLLIRNAELGAALAGHLEGAAIALMRGHGFTAVGSGIPEATYRAIYAVRNCQVQSSALQLGEPVYLTDQEARACEETVAKVTERAWNLWRRSHAADLQTRDQGIRPPDEPG